MLGGTGWVLSVSAGYIVYIVYRKTAIAIDTIINQKRFNEGEEESMSL